MTIVYPLSQFQPSNYCNIYQSINIFDLSIQRKLVQIYSFSHFKSSVQLFSSQWQAILSELVRGWNLLLWCYNLTALGNKKCVYCIPGSKLKFSYLVIGDINSSPGVGTKSITTRYYLSFIWEGIHPIKQTRSSVSLWVSGILL